ncbi:ABC transporter permease subunit [Sedimentibacter sp. MB31-C6]|uniref:ABC transporter permease subunit n=1 Tax=Sedimentibacter sp. MB31-C6 TaxID=3109366 RepID=UPI002DDD614C|nr:ABC transporter permease subunit [Sedimentibacter sp. MB36-C1]WSI05290.1 ABC transporter permease subunit [Sedimentibacter sp. MB36-C1]
MKSIIIKELKLSRKGLIIWCIVTLVTILYGLAEYPMVSQYSDSIMDSMNSLPRIVVIMFGMDGLSFDTSLDYHLIMFYWICLITFIHAVYIGVTILSRDQRDKTFEYIYSKPYKRNEIITTKILVGVINILTLAFVSWIGSIFTIIFIDGNAMSIINGRLVIGMITLTIFGMVLTQVVFFSIGLLFAAIFNSHNAALKSGFLFVLITYVIGVIIEYVGNINYLNFMSPFRYFIGTEVVNNGISILYVVIGTLITSVSIYLTYVCYNKKDLLY